VITPAVALRVRWAGGRTLGSVSSVAGRLRGGWLLRCLGPALVLLAAQVGALLATGQAEDEGAWPGWGAYLVIVAVAVLLVPLQAAAEEYVTRGWLVQALVALTRSRWLAAVLASALFVALHGTADPWAVADLAVFALALCWLTFRTGGLEAAIALHADAGGPVRRLPGQPPHHPGELSESQGRTGAAGPGIEPDGAPHAPAVPSAPVLPCESFSSPG